MAVKLAWIVALWSELSENSGSVPALAFSPDGKRLLTGGHDRTARLWDVATGKEVRKLEGHADVVTGVGLFTCCETVPTLGSNVVSPLYTAEIVRVPPATDDVVKAAMPLTIATGDPKFTLLSWN